MVKTSKRGLDYLRRNVRGLAVGDDVVRDALGDVRRDREADPMLPDCPDEEDEEPALAIATFTPMSLPSLWTSAPPELPGLIAASVWMTEIEIVAAELCEPEPRPGMSNWNGCCEPSWFGLCC